MKPLELIWFESISSFTEPVLGVGPIRASLKQFLYTLIGLALAFALMQVSLLLLPMAGLLIALAYLRPYGQDFETLLIDMVGFFFRKKSIGAVTVGEQKKQKEQKDKDKDKDKKDRVREAERRVVEEVSSTQAPTPTPPTPPTPTPIPIPIPPTTAEPITVPYTPTPPTTGTGTEQNLLHYIVPSTKDFSLEITEKEYVIATGESTIHIGHEQKGAVIVLTVRNGITDIVVNTIITDNKQ